jgi:hypothetical protein
MGKNVHVVRDGKQWAVKSEGNPKAVSGHRTQENARKAAIKIAKGRESDVVIHGRDGRIVDRDKLRFGSAPPRDTKH